MSLFVRVVIHYGSNESNDSLGVFSAPSARLYIVKHIATGLRPTSILKKQQTKQNKTKNKKTKKYRHPHPTPLHTHPYPYTHFLSSHQSLYFEMVNIVHDFLSKAQNLVQFRSSDFVQISVAYDENIY